MKLLHVLSQTELTGAESYAITLVREQVRAGHEVVIVSDTLSLAIPTGAEFISMPISKRSLMKRVQNIKGIRRLLKERRFDLIHAHSRAASWVCHAALRGHSRVAFVSTVHGRQHWHSRLKMNNVYGDRVIAICSNIRTHLSKEFLVPYAKIDCIANPVDEALYRPAATDVDASMPIRHQKTLGIFGRTSGPKGEALAFLAKNVLPNLLAEHPDLQVIIAGGKRSHLSPENLQSVTRLSEEFSNQVLILENQQSLRSLYERVDFVIGAGRIAIEALFMSKPVFAMGEHSSCDWVDATNFDAIAESNFGDIAADRFEGRFWNAPFIQSSIEKALKNECVFDLKRETVLKRYSTESVFPQIQNSYRQALLAKHYPSGIPSLMFHKVVDRPIRSQHQTYVSVTRLDAILQTLRRLHLETVTFRDLIDAIEGRRSFPKKPLLLTFDDGYKDTLSNALPLLEKYQMKAVVYLLANPDIQTNEWDTQFDANEEPCELLNREERQTLAQHPLIEIGSHGFNHSRLTALNAEQTASEIFESKKRLEAELKTRIESFAYPYGDHTAAHAKYAIDAGYSFGVGTDCNFGFENHLFRIFRANVFPNENALSIFKKTRPGYRRYFFAKQKWRVLRAEFRASLVRHRMRLSFALVVVVAMINSAVFLISDSDLNATPFRFRNLFGQTLAPCGSDPDSDTLVFCRVHKNGQPEDPSICAKIPAHWPTPSQTNDQCISPLEWQHYTASGFQPEIIWESTNRKALRFLPKGIADKAKRTASKTH